MTFCTHTENDSGATLCWLQNDFFLLLCFGENHKTITNIFRSSRSEEDEENMLKSENVNAMAVSSDICRRRHRITITINNPSSVTIYVMYLWFLTLPSLHRSASLRPRLDSMMLACSDGACYMLMCCFHYFSLAPPRRRFIIVSDSLVNVFLPSLESNFFPFQSKVECVAQWRNIDETLTRRWCDEWMRKTRKF